MFDNIQGPIQLEGRGFVRRSTDNYEFGEYKAFQNLIVTSQGTIKKRSPVHGLLNLTTVETNKFIGYRESEAVISGNVLVGEVHEGRLFLCKNSQIQTLGFTGAPPTFEANLNAISGYLTGGGSPVRGYGFEGFFKYNGKDHVIVWHASLDMGAGVPFGLFVAQDTAVSSGTATDIPLHDYIIGDRIFSGQMLKYPAPIVPSYLIHKDRLFIAVNDTVYFSKTADFMQWDVPSDGGFFKFPDKQIKKIVAIGDSIYVIFDTSVSVITYSQGPNMDSQVRVVSEVVGGEDAVGYEGRVYLSKGDAIYVVQGTSIEKLLDLELGIVLYRHNPGVFTSELKLVAYDDGLYLIPRKLKYSLPGFNDYESIDINGIYRIDLTSGTVSNYKFTGETLLHIADAIFVPIEDTYNTSKLVFMSTNPGISRSNFFYFGSDNAFMHGAGDHEMQEFGVDTFADSSGEVLKAYPIQIKMHIAGHSPDNMRYMIKKFRHISIQGSMPMWHHSIDFEDEIGPGEPELELILQAGVDDTGTEELQTLLTSRLGSLNSTYRFGVNQRAKTVDIIIQTVDGISPGGKLVSELVDSHDYFNIEKTILEIVDIRTMWSYTKRGTTNDPNDKS